MKVFLIISLCILTLYTLLLWISKERFEEKSIQQIYEENKQKTEELQQQNAELEKSIQDLTTNKIPDLQKDLKSKQNQLIPMRTAFATKIETSKQQAISNLGTKVSQCAESKESMQKAKVRADELYGKENSTAQAMSADMTNVIAKHKTSSDLNNKKKAEYNKANNELQKVTAIVDQKKKEYIDCMKFVSN